jgi:hypothetical protein
MSGHEGKAHRYIGGNFVMGIFDWFKRAKSNVDVLDDVIWLTKQAKYAGISASTARCLSESRSPFAVLLVAMFQDCLDELQAMVERSGFDRQRVVATMAGQLSGRSMTGISPDDSQTIEIIVAERHPLQAHNAAITEFAESLPCRCRLVHHVSLEDPLMKMFTGEWVHNLLQQMGMGEDEAIESRMVGRRIQEAARKIERQAVSDLRANSAEEWLQLNCPEWRKVHG